MDNEIRTVVTYNLDGAIEFDIPFDYLSRKFVKVSVLTEGGDKKLLENLLDYRYVSKTRIRLIGTQPGYSKVEIRRITSASERVVDFNDGSVLRATDLNVSQLQSSHIAEEARDQTVEEARLYLVDILEAADSARGSAASAKASEESSRESYENTVIIEKSLSDDIWQQLIEQAERFQQFLRASGYIFKGEYTSGIIRLESLSEVFQYNGQIWRAKAATSLPFTTTGTTAASWANDVNGLVSVGDAYLRQELFTPSGTSLVGHTRSKLSGSVQTLSKMLDNLPVSIWEFADRIVHKPTSDYQTWDWHPAVQATVDYCMSYSTAIGINPGMMLERKAYAPGGLYLLGDTVRITKVGSSGGSLMSAFTLEGDGRTSTIFQPTTEGGTAFSVKAAGFNIRRIGLRAGAKGQTGVAYGDKNVWLPAAHCVAEELGTSGFSHGVRVFHAFDSSWHDIFIQSVDDTIDGTLAGGFTIETYSGPANNSTTGGDNSNQLLLVRPTIETALGINCAMLIINGRSSSYLHHAITVIGGHIETHNSTAKLYHIKNGYNIQFYGTVMAQNGGVPVDKDTGLPLVEDKFYRLGWIEDTQMLSFNATRQGTTNRIAAPSESDTKAIAIVGSCQNVTFPGSHLTGPYQDQNATKHNAGLIIDYSAATKGKRAFNLEGCTVGDPTSRRINQLIRVGSLSGTHDFAMEVDETEGGLTVKYSTNFTDSAEGSTLLGLSRTGDLSVAGGISLGSGSGAATRSISANGSRVSFDTAGRIYLTPSSGNQLVVSPTAVAPDVDGVLVLGSPTSRFSSLYVVKVMYTASVGDFAGSGSPEGVVVAAAGSTYRRIDSGASGARFWTKETGVGSTGWKGWA